MIQHRFLGPQHQKPHGQCNVRRQLRLEPLESRCLLAIVAVDADQGVIDFNDGPAWTHALLPGSPAIDAGDPAILPDPNKFDQRGHPHMRVARGNISRDIVIDIGADEIPRPDRPKSEEAPYDAAGIWDDIVAAAQEPFDLDLVLVGSTREDSTNNSWANDARTERAWVRLVALLVVLHACQAFGAVITQHGYTERFVADVPGFRAGSGQLVEDAGVLYVVGGVSQYIKRITPEGVSDFARMPFTALSLAFVEDKFYVGARLEHVYEIDREYLTCRLMATFPTPMGSIYPLHIQGLSLAPSGFGNLAGKLIVSMNGAPGIASVDLNTLEISPITKSGFYTDHAFDKEGTLLALESKTGNVVRITHEGAISLFIGGFADGLDGIAIHPVTGKIYLADSAADQIWGVEPSGENVEVFATDVNFDSGWYPSPLRFSQNGETLYYGCGETSMTILAIDGFPAIPEPSPLVGDYNNDGQVDGRDILYWQLGESPEPRSPTDLAAWQANYGAASSLASAHVVPEPSTRVFVACALVGLLFAGRRGEKLSFPVSSRDCNRSLAMPLTDHSAHSLSWSSQQPRKLH